MKTIGLIGFSHGTLIADYYQEILKTIDPIKNNGLKYDILVYSIKKVNEDNHLIARLCQVYFYMMENGVKALIFTDSRLEMLSNYLNFAYKPLVLGAAEIIAHKIKQSNIKNALYLIYHCLKT